MAKGDKAPFSFEGLDRVLHEKARLSIMTSLADHPKGLSFTELRELCALTDGNLSRHVQILEEAGMLSIT
ncbi:transcriptional regulator, partial [Acinetobacter baumannii]